MTLHPEWATILKKAWSIKFILLAGFFAGLETCVNVLSQYVGDLPIPHGAFATLSFIASSGAFMTRLLVQKSMGASDANTSKP